MIPKPRINLLVYHGVFAPHAHGRQEAVRRAHEGAARDASRQPLAKWPVTLPAPCTRRRLPPRRVVASRPRRGRPRHVPGMSGPSTLVGPP
jgi:hypothetical protein